MSHIENHHLQSSNANLTGQINNISDGIWFGPNANQEVINQFGIKIHEGGAHNSKTIMFSELESLMGTGLRAATELRKIAVENNVLDKATHNTRTITYGFLSKLYGLKDQPPLTQILFRLWELDINGHRLLSLLVALARDSLFRQTAKIILNGAVGYSLGKAKFAKLLAEKYSERYNEKSIQSISRNCASSWTQSGHLLGSRDKIRQKVTPTPHTVALAGVIATLSGFSGPAMLNSGWFRILDLNVEQALGELRRAESFGLAKVRSFGEVTEISVCKPIANVLGVPSIE